MDLRDRIADAVARADCQTPATVHPLMEDYRGHADAVMEVVEKEINAAALRLTEGYEITYRADQKSLMDADEKATDLVARVRTLEGEVERLQALADVRKVLLETENEQLRHDLAAARGETVGTVPTWAEYAAAERAKEPLPEPKRAVSLEEARQMAAENARKDT